MRNKVDSSNLPEETTEAELKGWYMYDFANGAFFYSVLNFLPILIKGQAGEVAKKDFCGECEMYEWALDYANSGTCAFKGGCFSGDNSYTLETCDSHDGVINYFTNSTGPGSPLDDWKEDAGWSPDWRDDSIFVSFLGIKTGYASVSFLCTTISVVLQLLVFVGAGGLADYGDLRKKLFIGANTVGSLCCIGVMFGDTNESFVWNGVMMIIANVSYGFAVVFYNAYLPLLTCAHPDVTKVAEVSTKEEELIEAVNTVSSRISTRGFATGFTGQFIFLIINFAIFTVMADNAGFAARLNVALCGVWTLIFGGYCFYHLKTRPGPPLPEGENYASVSIKQVTHTFKSCSELPQLFLFLGAYFIFSDGCSTLAGSAAVFASIELQMTSGDIMLGILLVSVSAILSCVLWFNVEKRLGVPPKWILIMNLVILGLMPVYGMVAMTCQWEFYVMCFIFGLQTGSQQAYTRSIYSANVPQGHEAEYFSFYEVTDKGTAWAGPLVVGMVFDKTGDFRESFSALLSFFVVGIFVLLFFDPKKAAEQCKAFEEKEKKAKREMEGNNAL
eukprot:CAMPEP_0118671000 /NCGR_PEP_ID=MMETSP0785-20121206/21767_1 /TAXON_ID=91992 /ORGANISM="Bolidomonas pacifica, Strain CCMP 1866" /LENGTH=557 /DNA_ID=CAMNT_0006565853 /DNA_START=231 /DNA_END=1904 /DNA_ORIENTATION=-